MLPDLERKLLRILVNFSLQQRRMPMMGELTRKTGRKDKDLLDGLRRLERERYIEWPDPPNPQNIRILEISDREAL
ncbi:hypothetical protein V3851_03585 [Paenibacillus sp. M1]|uniref:MarR family transcriptional regulator n=1 Tax=Paenibacillus haidiansis TaxID=1574488 RepID=A0ABU7VMA9_9BACL